MAGKCITYKLTDALFQLTGTCITLRTNILTGMTQRKTSGTTRSCIHTQQQSSDIPFQDYAVIVEEHNTCCENANAQHVIHASAEESLAYLD